MDISGTFLWRKKVICSVTAKLPITSDASFLGITCYYRPQGSQSSLSYNLYNNCKSRLFGKFEKKISRRILGETYLWNLAAKCPFAPMRWLLLVQQIDWIVITVSWPVCTTTQTKETTFPFSNKAHYHAILVMRLIITYCFFSSDWKFWGWHLDL